MINHARTLLLNRNSSQVSMWPVDTSFAPLPLSGRMLAFRSLLFEGAETDEAMYERVSWLMPFVLDPEFADTRSLLDWRVTLESDIPNRDIRYGTPFSLYTKLRQEAPTVVSDCVSNFNTPYLFVWDNLPDTGFVDVMKRLKSVYADSKETTRRFSACLWAFLLRLEAMRLDTIA